MNANAIEPLNIELSFEFFPPKTPDGIDKLRATRAQLAVLNPKFVSVTFGAAGTQQSKQHTLDVVLETMRERLNAVPHLSCIGLSRDHIRKMLACYRASGIRHIVALRGDLPSGTSGADEIGEFCYASELVEFIRAEHGDWFRIEVAAYPECHPQAPSMRDDLQYFAHKINSGADAAITQYFYNAEAYFRFVEDVRKLGIEIPVTPGIMPITNLSRLKHFSAMCGAEVPRWLLRRLESFADDQETMRALGIDVVASLCRRLISGGAPGLHFYTLNSANATLEICKQLV